MQVTKSATKHDRLLSFQGGFICMHDLNRKIQKESVVQLPEPMSDKHARVT